MRNGLARVGPDDRDLAHRAMPEMQRPMIGTRPARLPTKAKPTPFKEPDRATLVLTATPGILRCGHCLALLNGSVWHVEPGDKCPSCWGRERAT